jgi:hypothetical protein
MSDYNNTDISTLVARLDDTRFGLRRLAADTLMQTEAGKLELRRLFDENPERIRQIFNGMPSDCLGKVTGNYIAKFNKSYLKIARNCPICNRSPSELKWIYTCFIWNECAKFPMMDFLGWISFCENCSLQIDSYRLEDTPPEVLATPDLHPYIITLSNDDSEEQNIQEAIRGLIEHGEDGLSRVILGLEYTEPGTGKANNFIKATIAFGDSYIETLMEKIDNSNLLYKLNLVEVFTSFRYVSGLRKLSKRKEEQVQEAAAKELKNLDGN